MMLSSVMHSKHSKAQQMGCQEGRFSLILILVSNHMEACTHSDAGVLHAYLVISNGYYRRACQPCQELLLPTIWMVKCLGDLSSCLAPAPALLMLETPQTHLQVLLLSRSELQGQDGQSNAAAKKACSQGAHAAYEQYNQDCCTADKVS